MSRGAVLSFLVRFCFALLDFIDEKNNQDDQYAGTNGNDRKLGDGAEAVRQSKEQLKDCAIGSSKIYNGGQKSQDAQGNEHKTTSETA
ncbi:MAG TPA: hypothetical protein VFM18_04600 [Methanosarcina sp.]|nr:hypothetical protein [Methanosarcina sp.]